MTLSRVLVLVALLVAPSALAQDEWKWDPTKERTPTKGSRQLSETESSETKKVVVRVGKKVLGSEETDKKVVARCIQEVLEVDGDEIAKARVTVEKWSHVAGQGEAADDCLEGQTILIEGHGEKTTWKCEDAKKELSDAAKAWIDENLASRDAEKNDKAFRSCLPEKPIAPGDGWSRDPAPIAKVFLGPDMALDAEKSSVKGKLGDVKTEGGLHVGRFTLDVVLVTKADDEKDTIRIELSAVFEGCLEPEKKDASTMKLTIKAKGRQKQDTDEGVALIDIDNVVTATETERPAGDAAPKK